MASDASKPKSSGRSSGRGLGRGLGALIVNTQKPAEEEQAYSGEGDTPRAAPQNRSIDDARQMQSHSTESGSLAVHDDTTATTGGTHRVSIQNIAPNPQQPRTQFDSEALEELAASIREHGIIQPLIVTAVPEEPGRYWLVAGERRWRAAQLAEMDEVPVTIREASPQQLLEWALVENIQRADLNALEEAAAYQTLNENFQLTQAEIAQRVGKSRSAVANTLRLLQLPHRAQEALLQNTLSAGHARALLSLEDEDLVLQALDAILSRALSVRQTEELVRRLLAAPPPQTESEPESDAAHEHLTFLENRLRDALGTRVNLNRNRDGSGRLVVHFYNDEDLAGIYQLIAGEDDNI